MQENRIPTHISVGHPAWSGKLQAKFAGQTLQQQAWSSPSGGDLPGLPENPSNHESSFPVWSGAFSCLTDHGLSGPTPNGYHQEYFQQDEGYFACLSASYPWACMEEPQIFADILRPIHNTADSYKPCFPPSRENLHSYGEVLDTGPGLGESYSSDLKSQPMSPTSCAQSVKEQNAFEEVELRTGFDVLNGKSLLCQETFFDTRRDSHLPLEGIATPPRSYQDNFGSELPVLIEPADIMLPSYVPLVFSEDVEKSDLHVPDYSRRNSFTQQDVLPSHFVYIAPEDNYWPYWGSDGDILGIHLG